MPKSSEKAGAPRQGGSLALALSFYLPIPHVSQIGAIWPSDLLRVRQYSETSKFMHSLGALTTFSPDLINASLSISTSSFENAVRGSLA